MKVRLINYGYKDFKVGEIIELTDKKALSLIAMQRAQVVGVEKEKKEIKEEPKKKSSFKSKTKKEKDDNDN